MARKLKVFQAQFGFFDTVVAASSQAAALRAWGTHQNLFASGEATVTTDEAAVAAALEHPETVLRRATGSKSAFALEPSSLPDVPDAPKRPKAAAAPKGKAKVSKPESPAADRGDLDKAESALQTIDQDRKRQEADFDRRQDELDQAKSDARSAYAKSRKDATAAVVRARKAYRDAGGRD